MSWNRTRSIVGFDIIIVHKQKVWARYGVYYDNIALWIIGLLIGRRPGAQTTILSKPCFIRSLTLSPQLTTSPIAAWDTKWPPWKICLHQLEKSLVFQYFFQKKCSIGGKDAWAKIRAHLCGPWSWLQHACKCTKILINQYHVSNELSVICKQLGSKWDAE